MLTASTFNLIDACKIDKGANFLVGKATSSFDPNFTKDTASAGDIAGGIVGGTLTTVASAAGVAGAALDTALVSVNVVSEALAYMTTNTVAYATTAIAPIMTLPIAYLTERTAYWTSEYMKDMPKEVIDETTKSNEERQEKTKKDNEKKSQNKVLEKIGKVTKDITYGTATGLAVATKTLQSVSTYVTEGGAWMEKNVKKITDDFDKTVHDFVGKTLKDVEDAKYKFLDAQAEQLGKAAYEKAKNKSKEAAKEKLQKVEQLKISAMTKAKALIAQALMKLKGLLGG